MSFPTNIRETRSRPSAARGEGGWIMLTLLLAMALLAIFSAAMVSSITFEIKRDREEEMIHRGVQYSRAIRTYYKKFGRYPAKLEDLENTNNLRFLRKRYKDPVTGEDFKLLRFGEVKLTFSAPLGGVSNLNGAPPGLQGNPVLGGATFGQAQPAGTFGSQGGVGATATSPDPAKSTDPNQPTDASSASSSATPQPGQQPGAAPGDALSGKTFGGMPVVGVVSTSKKDGVREFNHKKKYSEWQFIYDPATDRGGLLMTPNQPPLQGVGNQQLQPGQQGNTSNSPFGPSTSGSGNNPSGFGNNPPGLNNNPSFPQNPPASNPQNPQ